MLAAARASAEWPSADFKLVMGTPTLEGAAGIFRFEDCDGNPNPTPTLTLTPTLILALTSTLTLTRYEDCDGAIARMRECLHAAIVAAGGMPAVGGGDRSLARPPPGAPEPAPRRVASMTRMAGWPARLNRLIDRGWPGLRVA